MLSRHNIQHKARTRKAPLKRANSLARILVPFDFSPESKNALHFAALLARDLNASLTLLHVVEPLVSEADYGYGCVTRRSPNQKALKASHARLTSIARRLAASDGARLLAFVRGGAAETEIVQAATDLAADLIVIGSRGSNRARIPGSTAERVLHDAPCPVLVVRKKQLSRFARERKVHNET